MSGELVNVSTGEIVDQCSAERARELTDEIKSAIGTTWDLVTDAYLSRAWAALGYESWDDYCNREFGSARLRLPREERRDAIASLRESGLSTRAIAAATGDSRETVRRSLAGDTNVSPEPIESAASGPTSAEITGESTPVDLPEAAARTPVKGIDGKTYAPSKPAAGRTSSAVAAFVDGSQAVQDARYTHNFFKALCRDDGWMTFDPDRLGPLLDQTELDTIERHAARAARFVDAVKRARTGLRVIEGGAK